MLNTVKARVRWIPLLGLLLLSQCCCIILPFSGQVDLNASPTWQQIADWVRMVVVTNLEAGRLIGSMAGLMPW